MGARNDALRSVARWRHRRGRSTLDTLAAAYAESGDFDKAVATQRDALAALGKDDHALHDAFEQHLDHYLKQQPWRE